jgi:hypothetical protein
MQAQLFWNWIFLFRRRFNFCQNRSRNFREKQPPIGGWWKSQIPLEREERVTDRPRNDLEAFIGPPAMEIEPCPIIRRHRSHILRTPFWIDWFTKGFDSIGVIKLLAPLLSIFPSIWWLAWSVCFEFSGDPIKLSVPREIWYLKDERSGAPECR